MDFKHWELDEEQFTEALNQAKDNLLSQLKEDQIITEEQAVGASKKYVIILKKPSVLSRLFKRDKIAMLVVAISDNNIAALEKEE